jgi:hypothetical protein
MAKLMNPLHGKPGSQDDRGDQDELMKPLHLHALLTDHRP